MHRTKVKVVEEALDANNTIAAANRADFDRAGVTVINFMSAPGAGKTTLLERVVGRSARRARRRAGGRRAGLDGRRPSGQPARAGDPDQHRRRASAASATSTPTWCARRIPSLPLDDIDLLIVENVGNLVCPAEFRIGEDARVMVSAVTEGVDKPLKYPLMFRACELVHRQQDRPAPPPRRRPRPPALQHRPGPPRRRADRAQRQDRRGRRRVARLADADRHPRGGGRGRMSHARSSPRIPRARLAALLAARTEANARFFDAEAERLARLCHLMAERFARGGRLVAFGRSPAARSDARHVAVEFVHPVIVGKRALPALGLAGEGGALAAQVALLARPDDIAMAFGAGEDGGEAAAAIAVARERGCLTIAFDRRAARRVGVRAADDGRRRAPGAGGDALPRAVGARPRVLRAPRTAQRALGARAPTTPARRASSTRSSTSARTSSSRWWRTCGARCWPRRPRSATLRAQTLGENAERARRAAAAALRACFERGGKLLALGNGGSATDAMDVVADFRAGAGGRPSTSPRTRRSSPRSPTTSAPTRSSAAR